MRRLEFVLDADVRGAVRVRRRPHVDAERDDALVFVRETPLEHAEWLAYRERAIFVLERDCTVAAGGELGDVRVLLEREGGRAGCERFELQTRFGNFGGTDGEVEIALELECLDATFARERQRQGLADLDVNTRSMSVNTNTSEVTVLTIRV